MLARVYIGCHLSGRAKRPLDSDGNSAPVGVPKPKSRSISNCSSGESLDENFAIPTLLETWTVWARVRFPVVLCASVITRVRPLLVTGMRHGKLLTIEGNTNDGGSREGIGVFARHGRTIGSINRGFIEYD